MTGPLLEARDLTRHFGGRSRLLGRAGDPVRAVDGVDLALPPAGTVGLVGESGCGKSTLGRLLAGLTEPTAGEVRWEGRVLAGFDAADWLRFRRQVQFVFQDPLGSLNPRKRVRRILDAPLRRLMGMTASRRDARMKELMHQVGLDAGHLARFPHEFSGGQAQRVAVARALAVEPRVLILDEPVSALDVSVQAQILKLLRTLRRELDLAYLFISHDLAVVEQLVDEVAVMYLGRIVESGSRATVFGNPQHPYTRVLLASVPVPGQRHARPVPIQGDPPSPTRRVAGCPFAPRCYRAEDYCRDHVPPLADTAVGHPVACHFSGDTALPDTPAA